MMISRMLSAPVPARNSVSEFHVHFAELQLGENRTDVQVLQVIHRVLVVLLQALQLVGSRLVERVELVAGGLAGLQVGKLASS